MCITSIAIELSQIIFFHVCSLLDFENSEVKMPNVVSCLAVPCPASHAFQGSADVEMESVRWGLTGDEQSVQWGETDGWGAH